MRHPHEGGGMNDVVMLRELFGEASRGNSGWEKVRETLAKWRWKRKPLASMISILSVTLYDSFGTDDTELEVLRAGCFNIFRTRRGMYERSRLSAFWNCTTAPSPLLAGHIFAVAFYAI